MATMRDVAHRAGVSAKTVSRVVNNDRYVSADVRERVERAIDELQYVPNMLAVTFRTGRDAAIGVAVPGVSDPLLRQHHRCRRARGQPTRRRRHRHRRRLGAVARTAVHRSRTEASGGRHDHLPGRPRHVLPRPWQKRTPLVFADREAGRLTADAVLQDDVGGGHEATRHLISHGHRSIAFMGDDAVTGLLRLKGWQDALVEAGLPRRDDLMHVGASTPRR